MTAPSIAYKLTARYVNKPTGHTAVEFIIATVIYVVVGIITQLAYRWVNSSARVQLFALIVWPVCWVIMAGHVVYRLAVGFPALIAAAWRGE